MAIVTISRGTFSGGKSLAECVAERLGYRCLPRTALYEAVKRYGVPEAELARAISQPPSLWEHVSSHRAHYLACARAALVREVKDENVVYHGLAGHFLLEGVPHVFMVRVIADMELRIKEAMERRNLSREEAIRLIHKQDSERMKWTKFLYHVDWWDPQLYDMIINLDHLSLSSACDIVCRAVSFDQFNRTPESQKVMDDLVLSTEVRAMIAANAASMNIADAGLHINADEGIVTIGGAVGSQEDVDKLRKIVSAIQGVKEIRF